MGRVVAVAPEVGGPDVLPDDEGAVVGALDPDAVVGAPAAVSTTSTVPADEEHATSARARARVSALTGRRRTARTKAW